MLRRHFAATVRRDYATAMADYDEGVVLLVEYGPETGLHLGKEATGRWFGDWLRTFRAAFDFEIVDVHEGRDAVVLQVRHSARGSGSGVELTEHFHYAYWLRAGKIVRVEVHRDREAAWRAAGVVE